MRLKTVDMSTNIETIGQGAFAECSNLISIDIGSKVTSIGWLAFSVCERLTSVTFQDTSSWYRTKDYLNWLNKIGGISVPVTAPSLNAGNFSTTYDEYYWYKL